MKASRPLAVLLATLVLAGCANLQEIRDYADASAEFSAYTELTTRFRDTYQREQPYLSGEAERLARDNDQKRQAAYADLLVIHQRVTLYMQTLARLAGDDAFDLSPQIDSLSAGIKAHPELGIDAQQVDAAANLSQVISRWLTASYQQRAVRSMITEGDPHLQKMLVAMLTLIRYYRQTSENEKNTVLGFFAVEIPFADPSQDRLLLALARAQLQTRSAEYNELQRQYDAAEQGIRSMAEGHRQLLANLDRLSSAEARAMISKFAQDIKTIRENLGTVRS
ncbi:MAG: hypothetical protein C4531_05220 [Desulfurivibrio sp.]|nr:MAG: hypothetical protein C4531_05220 [Desulfurivibrio sp.]